MGHNKLCPISFGDCSDCNFYQAKACIHKHFDKLDREQLKQFLILAQEVSYIDGIELVLLEDMAQSCTDEE